MGIINTFRTGLRSLGEDAARSAFARDAAQSLMDSKKTAAVTGGMSARELAEAYPKMQLEANKFIDDFHAAYKQPEFSNLPDAVAYGAGRKLGGVRDAVGGMVQSMGGAGGLALQGAFLAPMIAPMFMQETEQPQLQPYEQEALARAQMREMHRQRMMQQGYSNE